MKSFSFNFKLWDLLSSNLSQMSICCKRVIWRYCYKGLDSKDVIYFLQGLFSQEGVYGSFKYLKYHTQKTIIIWEKEKKRRSVRETILKPGGLTPSLRNASLMSTAFLSSFL